MSVESALATLVPTDQDRFLAVLELAYLAASADGLAETERVTLAHVLADATGSRIDRDTFAAHFYDLDCAVEALGRRERLARTAADFTTDEDRADAIRFATIVAMADGTLHDAERGVLLECGEHFAWTAEQIDVVIRDATGRIGGDFVSFVNRMSKEVNCKVVYYGPGLCGKTTNLQWVFSATKPETRGKMISLATETERTLFFDFLPLDLGRIGEFNIRFHLYTVPGQVFYDASRKLILRGADGIVFVADSQPGRMEANIESFENLETNLEAHNMSLATTPHVVQYNKRDMPEVSPIEELRAAVNKHGAPEFEAAAKTGQGVFDTLKGLAKPVLKKLAQQPPT